jgi:lysophospholipase L1-like esterase
MNPMRFITSDKLKIDYKEIIKLFIFNLIILLFIIIAIELMVRIIYPDIKFLVNSKNLFQDNRYGNSFGLAPNIHGYSFEAEVITDARGFRIDPSSQMAIGKQVILVLGDSVSFGVGVAARDTFPLILQRHLKNCQIVNGSVIGYSFKDYYNILTYCIDSKLEFEGVIVSICLNDFSTESQANIDKQLRREYNKKYPNKVVQFIRHFSDNYLNFIDLLKEYSKSYQFIKNMMIDGSKNYFWALTTSYDMPTIEGVICDNLKKINDLAIKNGKWIVFCVFPYEYQLRQSSYKNRETAKPQILINAVAEKEKLPVIDLLPDLYRALQRSGLTSRDMYLFCDPMHLSRRGHQIAAQCLYEEILKSGLAY